MLNLSPSLMCADQGYFAEEVKQLEAAGATTFHMDIMDGEFVPNFALSWAQVGYCRKISKIKFRSPFDGKKHQGSSSICLFLRN